MRKVQDKIEEVGAEHAAQVESVMQQYQELLQQVDAGRGCARGAGGESRGAEQEEGLLTWQQQGQRVAWHTSPVTHTLPAPLPPQVGEYHRSMEAAMAGGGGGAAAQREAAVRATRVR